MLGAKELVNKICRVFAHIDLTCYLMKKHNKEVTNTNEDSGSDNEYLVDDEGSAAGGALPGEGPAWAKTLVSETEVQQSQIHSTPGRKS